MSNQSRKLMEDDHVIYGDDEPLREGERIVGTTSFKTWCQTAADEITEYIVPAGNEGLYQYENLNAGTIVQFPRFGCLEVPREGIMSLERQKTVPHFVEIKPITEGEVKKGEGGGPPPPLLLPKAQQPQRVGDN